MRLLQLVLGGTCLAAIPSCTIIDEILDEPCGGHDKKTDERPFAVPQPLESGGTNFTTGIEGGERYLRWSTDFTNVCSEEHAYVGYQVNCNGILCRAEGDYTTFPLFGGSVTLNGITGENLTIYSGSTDVGLGQHYEGVPGMFSAGLMVYVPAEVDTAQLAAIIQSPKITSQYRDAP
jgi:hypothetical protein